MNSQAKTAIDIWSRDDVVSYLRLLAQTGQIRECAHLHVECRAHRAFHPTCELHVARQVLAYNVTTDITGLTAPSSYWWLRCPRNCPQFEPAEDFLARAEASEESGEMWGQEELAAIATVTTATRGEPDIEVDQGPRHGPDAPVEPTLRVDEPDEPAAVGGRFELPPVADASPELDARSAVTEVRTRVDDFSPALAAEDWDDAHEAVDELREDGAGRVRWLVAGAATAAFLVGLVLGQVGPVHGLLHGLIFGSP